MKTSGLLSVIIAVVLSIGVSSCGGKAKRLLSDLTDTAVQNATTGASYDKEAKFSDEEPSLLEQIKEMNLAGRLERTERMFGSPSDNLLPDELIVYYWEGLSLESVNTALCAKPESVAVPRLSADVVDSIVKSSPVPQAVERRDYVSITHWLAGQIGADVITESYWRTLDIAGFRLPEGSDGLAVAERLMTDYQNLVMLVEPGFQGKACKWEDPEETDLNMIDEDPDTFPVEPCWGAIRLGCRSIWKDPEGSTGLDGEGVYVAMLDTGLDIDYYEGEEYHDGHDEFNGRWETPGSDTGQIYDFTGDDEDHDEIPEDADGHGTFVSGLIAANDGSNEQGGGIVGVAYEATLIPIKIIDWAIDPFGWENFIPALDLVILLVTPTEEDGYGKNIRALNMSFSSELTDPPLAVQEKLSSLWLDYNVANVAAAMNDGKCYPDEQGRMPYPAGCSHVVAVGATEWRATSNKYEDSEWNNWRTSFSNWGDYIDFVAPGEGLLSTYPKDHPSGPYKSDGSGTSFSAPLIAGAFALIAQHKPEWTPTQAVHVLRRTAHSVGFYGNPAAGGLEGDRRKLPDLDALWQAIG
ncbi:S8/S53 family peptidase, partial [bacterium]|nr:S8/S53 family peptidase [bacterium]